MALTEFDHALLSAIAYSNEFNDKAASPNRWENGVYLQDYIIDQLNRDGPLCRPPLGGQITEDEWRAILTAATQSEGLKGFEIASVETNPDDGSEMIYLENQASGEGCFVFEGTCTPKGWFQDGSILAFGDTDSQRHAVEWAQGIMDANDRDGKRYHYEGGGHSKGGSQMSALTRNDPRIAAAYSFDGPGDDREHPADTRIHCINNENDFISSLLFPSGGETLLRSHSDDPSHLGPDGAEGVHSPANLFNFSYDENGVLVCTGLGSDVTSEGGAWYRGLIRTMSQVAGSLPISSRDVLAREVGLLLEVWMDDGLSLGQKISHTLEIVVDMKQTMPLILATVFVGVMAYGAKRIMDLLVFLLGEDGKPLADALLVMARAINYVGEQLMGAVTVAAGIISSLVDQAWDQVCAWASAAIEGARDLYGAITSFFEGLVRAIFGNLSGNAKIYDFSSSRLEELHRTYERLLSMGSTGLPNWTGRYGGATFMKRLSLDFAQAQIISAVGNERSVGEEVISKASEVFGLAEAEDRRYSRELSSVASAVNSATILLA